MFSRKKRRQYSNRRTQPPTMLDGYLFQLSELDEDLAKVKDERDDLAHALNVCRTEISRSNEMKAIIPGRSDYYDRIISAEQNKAMGLASRLADADTSIDKKRRERLELIEKINQQEQPGDEIELQAVDSSEEEL